MTTCPCGSGARLDACCGPILVADDAPTAEALMRSRYTAHVLGQVDYLVDTHDPATRGGLDRAAIARWALGSTWLGLSILATVRGGRDDDDGIVEFEAAYASGGARHVHRERSRFRRCDGRWRYVSGAPGKRR